LQGNGKLLQLQSFQFRDKQEQEAHAIAALAPDLFSAAKPAGHRHTYRISDSPNDIREHLKGNS